MSYTKEKIKWLEFCDWPMISALNSENLNTLMMSLKRTIAIRLKKHSTAKVNKCFTELVDKNPLMFRGAKKHVPFKSKVFINGKVRSTNFFNICEQNSKYSSKLFEIFKKWIEKEL